MANVLSPEIQLAIIGGLAQSSATRLRMRRLPRFTYAFSKKFGNFEAAIGLHFAYDNFVKQHRTVGAIPAMAAGIERDFWTVRDLVKAVA